MEILHDLYESVKIEDWVGARSIQITSQKVEYTDESQYNALHWALSSQDIPSDLLKSLLSASVHASLSTTRYGETPLNYAIRRDSTSDENILMAIEACPAAVLLRNNDDCTPLHLAILYERSSKIISNLITHQSQNKTEAFDAVEKIHIQRNVAFFFKKWANALEKVLASRPIKENGTEDYTTFFSGDSVIIDDCGCKKTLRHVCDRVILLLQMDYFSNAIPSSCEMQSPSPIFRSLQTCLRLNYCPTSFISVMLRMYPEEAWRCDERGNLLLHLAATITNQADKVSVAIHDLIQINHQAAQVPNDDGRLPLNLVIENPSLVGNSVINTVFLGCPSAIGIRDVGTHMYPFMLAATSGILTEDDNKSSFGQSYEYEEYMNKMSSCFSLLMECPHVLVMSDY